jgi:LacI family transcriptional regulator
MNERRQNRIAEPVTIKQLAQMLGMAHSTVSRALNGHPAISEATRKRIEEAAARHGYVPNSAARILRNARSGVVGLVIPDIRNDFYTAVATAIADTAAELSLQMVVATTDDQPRREQEAVRSMLKARAESVIIAPTADPAPETVEMLQRVRALQLLRHHSSIEAPSITLDERAGIRMATRHLQELGHRRIAYIGRLPNVSTGRARLQGFVDCFADPREVEQRIVLLPPREAYGAQGLHTLLERGEPPTAVVLGSPQFTSGVLEAAGDKGLRIPEDLSLVSYGDTAWNRFLFGGLTTVALPEKEIAEGCAEMLRRGLGASAGPEERRPESEASVCFQPRLVVRRSTGKPAIGET